MKIVSFVYFDRSREDPSEVRVTNLGGGQSMGHVFETSGRYEFAPDVDGSRVFDPNMLLTVAHHLERLNDGRAEFGETARYSDGGFVDPGRGEVQL